LRWKEVGKAVNAGTSLTPSLGCDRVGTPAGRRRKGVERSTA
jgi:hypothetical protein